MSAPTLMVLEDTPAALAAMQVSIDSAPRNSFTRRQRPDPATRARMFVSRPRGEALPAIDLLPRIERVCTARGIRLSRFGRRAVGDPRLVYDIRNGRGLRATTRERVEAYIKRLEWLVSLEGGAA